MQLTIMRRAAAATAVVAMTASLAVVTTLGGGTASAIESTVAPGARADSTLSIRVVRSAVAPGRSTAVRGRLAAPGVDPSGRTVVLEARSQGTGGFTPVGTAVSGTAGVVRVRVTPETTTAYRWRYAGALDADRARSGVTRVRVRIAQHPAHRTRTTLSIRLKSVGPTDRTVIRGRLFARGAQLARRWVVLVSRPAGGSEWGFMSAARTDDRGRVAYGVEPVQNTAYRLAFLGSPKLRPARSARVVEQMPSDVSISAVPGVVDPGTGSAVSGVVTSAGAAVPGAAVTLVARVMRRGARWTPRQTGTTAGDGTVTFAVVPDRSTAYRLRVAHGPGVRAGTSQVAQVIVRAGTSLSIRGRTGRAGYIVEGQLRGGGVIRPGRTVTLQSMAQGATDWTPVASSITDRRGHVEFVQPPVAGTQYRLTYDGEERLVPSVSGTVVS